MNQLSSATSRFEYSNGHYRREKKARVFCGTHQEFNEAGYSLVYNKVYKGQVEVGRYCLHSRRPINNLGRNVYRAKLAEVSNV